MRHFMFLLLPMLALIATSAAPTPVQAAAGGVQDNAHLFSNSAVDNANGLIRQIRTGDHRDVFVVTYPAVPDDRQDELKSKGKQRFFAEWAEDLGRERGVSGVVILIIKNPGHLEIAVGMKTRDGIFTVPEDRKELEDRMLKHLKGKEDTRYDDALLEGLQFIKTTMDRHPAKGAAGATPANPTPPNSTPTPYSAPPIVHQSTGSGIGGWVCLGVGILVVVFLIISIANRNRTYGGGYGAPPGGYPPGYSGPYPQGGGGYYGGGGGGGGGFGRGLLGGLLGGALGAWGYEKFNQGNQSPNYNPQQPNTTGGYPDNTPDQTDTSFSGTGADFDSNSSSTDSSGGSNDSSGGDFGGGGDSGGGGGDSGGGGGDSGGGGGDF